MLCGNAPDPSRHLDSLWAHGITQLFLRPHPEDTE